MRYERHEAVWYKGESHVIFDIAKGDDGLVYILWSWPRGSTSAQYKHDISEHDPDLHPWFDGTPPDTTVDAYDRAMRGI